MIELVPCRLGAAATSLNFLASALGAGVAKSRFEAINQPKELHHAGTSQVETFSLADQDQVVVASWNKSGCRWDRWDLAGVY